MLLIIATMILSALILKPISDPGKTDPLKYTINGFLGYGMSVFDEDDLGSMGQDSYIPVGAQLLYNLSPKISIGTELEFSANSFQVENSYYEAGYYYNEDASISLTTIGLMVRYFPSDDILLRGGLATYSGSAEYYDEYYGSTEKTDIESGLGFNFGGGYQTSLSENIHGGIEGIYHMVSLGFEDVSGSYDLDHWAIRAFFGKDL